MLTVVSVMVDDMNDDAEERASMRRFLSAISFEFDGAIVIDTDVGTNARLGEYDPPAIRQRPMQGMSVQAPESIEVSETSEDLTLCLALMREGLSSSSGALAFLSYWKVIEVIVGQSNVPNWIGDDFAHLNETRVAAAHAIPDTEGNLRYNPDDPALARRLYEDRGADP